ncbi:MAG TPA: hypothetical protein VEH51_01425 [Burkholderiales bacterium]|nr:hypothetical protein [Burkholderiales bacterium]
MTDDDETQCPQDVRAPRPEQFWPTKAADQLDQRRIAEGHQHAALVEDGQ